MVISNEHLTTLEKVITSSILTLHIVPLSDTSSFNDYAKEAFNDDAQIRLKEYYDRINEAGFRFMLSNSECKGKNEEENFFDVLYGAYNRTRIYEQNGTSNIVIRNYQIQESWQR